MGKHFTVIGNLFISKLPRIKHMVFYCFFLMMFYCGTDLVAEQEYYRLEPGGKMYSRGYEVTNRNPDRKTFFIPNKTESEFFSVRDSSDPEIVRSLIFNGNTGGNHLLTRKGSILEYGGEAITLIGYGAYGLVSEKGFDFKGFLNKIADHNLNFVRIWINYHWVNSLGPFKRDERGRYNLNDLSQEYFDRLADFVAYAEFKGIFVQVTLFDAVALVNSGNRWPYFPYNAQNNVNGIIWTNQTTEFVANSGPVWEIQKKLITRAVSRLGDYGNVIYEVMNEPTSHQVAINPFHNNVINFLRSELEPYSGSKIISVNIENDGDLSWAESIADLVAIHVHHPRSRADNYNNTSIPVIISNDGDETQGTSAQGSVYDAHAREKRTKCFLNRVFGTGAADGHNHFEFLDKGIYNGSWGSSSLNYDAKLSNVNEGILNILNPDTGYFTSADCSNGGENGWGK